MTIEISEKFTKILQEIINMGLADSYDEAVRQSIIAYNIQIENNELFLVDKAVESEMYKIKDKKIQLYQAQDVFSDIGL